MYNKIKDFILRPHIVLIAVTIVMVATHFGHVYPDSRAYINVTEYFMFENTSLISPYLMAQRPLVPLIASIFSPMFGVAYAISLINSVFWILSALVFYEWSKIWLGDKDTAFYSAIFYTTAVPMLMIGAAVLVDMCAWFFMTLILYLVEKSRREESLKYYALTGLSIGLGTLSKEIVLSLILYVMLVFTYDILSKKRSVKDGLSKILIIGFFTSILPALGMLQFGENLMLYYRLVVPGTISSYNLPYEQIYPIETFIIGQYGAFLPVPIKHILHYVLSLGGAFWLTLPFVPSGLNTAKKQGKIVKNIFLLIPLAFTITARLGITRRLAFPLFPFIIPMGVSGVSTLFGKYKYGNIMMTALYVITTNVIFLLAPGSLLN